MQYFKCIQKKQKNKTVPDVLKNIKKQCRVALGLPIIQNMKQISMAAILLQGQQMLGLFLSQQLVKVLRLGPGVGVLTVKCTDAS